jgi:hypothetical protein
MPKTPKAPKMPFFYLKVLNKIYFQDFFEKYINFYKKFLLKALGSYTCTFSKFRKSYLPPAARIRVNRKQSALFRKSWHVAMNFLQLHASSSITIFSEMSIDNIQYIHYTAVGVNSGSWHTTIKWTAVLGVPSALLGQQRKRHVAIEPTTVVGMPLLNKMQQLACHYWTNSGNWHVTKKFRKHLLSWKIVLISTIKIQWHANCCCWFKKKYSDMPTAVIV